MAGNRCFLCAKTSKIEDVKFEALSDCKVSASQKPVQVVLQHLANCIKTKLVFEETDVMCSECYKELADYDNLMVNLLSFQKKLTQQLSSVLTMKADMDIEHTDSNELVAFAVTIEEEEEHLVDAFNPELDAQEEFITVVEEDSTMDDNENSSQEMSDNDDSDEVGSRRRVNQECVVCNMTFKSKLQLQNHITETHNTKTFVCDICGAVRRDEEYLELHMNIHEGKTENECRYCDKRYTRPVNALRHMRKHWDKKKYQCEKCGERFSLDNMLYNHRMLHEAEENPLICSVCNQSFKSRKTFNHHMTIHQENRPRHQCTHCSKSFTERYTLKMHMKTHGVDLGPAPRTRSSFNTTGLTKEQEHQETEAAVTALVEDIPNENVCVICSTNFESKHALDNHLQHAHDVILK